jgi:hypothetical protein
MLRQGTTAPSGDAPITGAFLAPASTALSAEPMREAAREAGPAGLWGPRGPGARRDRIDRYRTEVLDELS